MIKSKLFRLVSIFITAMVPVLPASALESLVEADALPPSHAYVQTIEYFGDLVARQSKGDITVAVRADGALGSDEQMLRAVQEGHVAMVRVNLGVLANRMRNAELLSLPYLIRSEGHLRKTLEGPFGERLDRELEANGYVRLMHIYGGPRNLYCTRPIYGASDFQGLRVRTLDARVSLEMFRALGAIPVALPIGKTAEAFRSRQIDCSSDNIETYVAGEYYRYAPYLIIDEHARIPDVLLVSRKVWDRLTPQQQKLMRDAASATTTHMQSRWRESEETNLKMARKAGAKIITHEEIANNAIEEQAVRFYNHVIRNDEDLDAVMKVVMLR